MVWTTLDSGRFHPSEAFRIERCRHMAVSTTAESDTRPKRRRSGLVSTVADRPRNDRSIAPSLVRPGCVWCLIPRAGKGGSLRLS